MICQKVLLISQRHRQLWYDYYYKAVLWAMDKGITKGGADTHFGPTIECNRAQIVTFLYRTYA